MNFIDESSLLLAYLLAVVHVLGLIAALHAIVTVRTAQGAIAWALSLAFIPLLTLLPYLVFGRSKFDSYIRSRRAADIEIRRGLETPEWQALLATASAPADANTQAHFDLRTLVRMSGVPAMGGNEVRLLINGEASFDAIFEAIAAAHHVVLVEFFIIHDDGLGRRLQSALLERARAGVKVCLLYDSVGSHALPEQYAEALRAEGVQVNAFASRRGLLNRYQLNFRNHRKIVVVDGDRGFLGGHNVGDEYLGLNPLLSPWRDTHVEVRGPAIVGLQKAFAEDWFWATRSLPPVIMPAAPFAGDMLCQVFASGPADAQESCSLFFVEAINQARHRVWLSSPYFVPDEAVMSALRLAVLRGVDVRILIPSRADHRTVYAASSLYAMEAVQMGIRVFRYQPGFLHQKVVLVDDRMAAVGSANLDNRSFRLNFEIMLVTVDAGFAQAVESMLLEDFSVSLEQRPEDRARIQRLQHFGMRVARLFSPLL
ncbi:MAG: cardiolipin synthase [Pseudomonadota bacterium]|nr:cardiolipin synthase [Pseudomonadota bacterium]